MPGPGTGRYTQYVPNDRTKMTRLEKLFTGVTDEGVDNSADLNTPSAKTPPFFNLDAAQAAQVAVKRANSYLRGSITQPDGTTIKLNYTSYDDQPNDTEWSKAGDPVNKFSPDIRSPGPGNTTPTDAPPSDDLKDAAKFYESIHGAGFDSTSPNLKQPAGAGNTVSKAFGSNVTPGSSV